MRPQHPASRRDERIAAFCIGTRLKRISDFCKKSGVLGKNHFRRKLYFCTVKQKYGIPHDGTAIPPCKYGIYRITTLEHHI